MKLRLKYQKLFQNVSFDNKTPLIKDIILAAAEKYDLNFNNVEVSLNANDYYSLESHVKDPLSEFSLVSGDIIYVRLNGAYDNIKNIMRLEISSKLEEVLANCNINESTNIIQKLALPIHLFMSEAGFYISEMPKSFVEMIFSPESSLSTSYPDSSSCCFYSGSLLRLRYNYIEDDLAVVYLTVNLVGSYICVYGSYPNKRNIYSYIFKEKEFILQNPTKNTVYKADTLYKNLSRLSSGFKNSIAIPLRIDIHLVFYIPTHPFFQILPNEILNIIFEYLDLKSLQSLLQTCRRLNEAVRFCNKIWKRILMKTFQKSLTIGTNFLTDSTNVEEEPDCYYKKFCLQQKERRLKRKALSSIRKEISDEHYI